MPLAPKKINSNLPSPIILTVILCSIIYWIYLSLSTRMDIAFDAIDYQTLAERIYTQGWISYFTTGPNREPLYPLLISLSMHIGHWIGLPYTKIMAIGGMIILSLSQLWIYHILRLLKIGTRVCVVVLIYWALSPALNNSAFSLFSEIITYPLF